MFQQTPKQGVAHCAVNGGRDGVSVHTARPVLQPRQRSGDGRVHGRRQPGQGGDPGLRRQGYPLGMDAPHIVGRRVGQIADAVGNPHGPVAGGEIHADVVGIIGADGAVVGGYDAALRRVDATGHFGEGDAALPLVLPVPARHGQRRGGVAGPAGDFAPALVADVAVNVGHQQVVHRVNPALHRIGQFGDAVRFQHCRQDVRPRIAAVGGRVAQGEGGAGRRLAGDNGAVMGGPGA